MTEKLKEQWGEKTGKVIIANHISREEIIELRNALAKSYGCEKVEDMKYRILPITDQHDVDRNTCVLLEYYMDKSWNKTPANTVRFRMKIYVSQEMRAAAEAWRRKMRKDRRVRAIEG